MRSWNRDGEPGPWSAAAQWEMGLLKPEDWTAKWVEAKKVSVELKIVSASYHTPDGKVSKDVTELVARIVSEQGPEFGANNKTLGGDPAKDIAKQLTIDLTVRGTPMSKRRPPRASILPATKPHKRKSRSRPASVTSPIATGNSAVKSGRPASSRLFITTTALP